MPYQGGQSSLYQLFWFYSKTLKHHQLTEAVSSTHFWVFVKISFFLFIILFPHALAWGQTSYSLSLFLICNDLTGRYDRLCIVLNFISHYTENFWSIEWDSSAYSTLLIILFTCDRLWIDSRYFLVFQFMEILKATGVL